MVKYTNIWIQGDIFTTVVNSDKITLMKNKDVLSKGSGKKRIKCPQETTTTNWECGCTSDHKLGTGEELDFGLGMLLSHVS